MKMRDILTRESENTQQVYIYEEKDHWYAYGHSAQFIKQLHDGFVKVKEFANNTHSKVTDRVEVDFKAIIEKFTIILCSDTELVLKCPTH